MSVLPESNSIVSEIVAQLDASALGQALRNEVCPARVFICLVHFTVALCRWPVSLQRI